MTKSSITVQGLIDGMVNRIFQKFKRFSQDDRLEELTYWLDDGCKLTATIEGMAFKHFDCVLYEKSICIRAGYYDIYDNFIGYGEEVFTEGMDLKSLRDEIENIVKDYLGEE